MPGTRSKYRRERSRALSGALLLVVVVRLVVDGAEERKNVLLFAALDVFIQGGGDGIFFSAVAAQLLGLFDQAVVNGEVASGDGDRDAEFAVGAALVAEHQRKRVSVLAARFHETVRWAQDGILSREENKPKKWLQNQSRNICDWKSGLN